MITLQKTLHEPEKIFETGELPLLVQCEDIKSWVCKHSRNGTTNLSNELIASRFASVWGIKTPEICLINVLEEHIPSDRGMNLQNSFFEKPCFGSLYLDNSIEINSLFIGTIRKSNFRSKINNKIDVLKIALFDIWLGNEDRNQNNYNLLLDISQYNQYSIIAIDHNAIFNTNAMFKYGAAQLTDDETLINTDLYKAFFKKGKKLKEIVESLVASFYLCTTECKHKLDEILNEVPLEWGLSLPQTKAQMLETIFSETWLKECETNFRTQIQSSI